MPRRLVREARGSIDVAWKQWTLDHGPLAGFLRRAKPLGSWLTTAEVATQTALPDISGVLYVGDACGTIEPLAGQGMTMALAGAALAEYCLITGREDACQVYFAAWHQQFGKHVRRANWLAGLLRRPRLLAACLPLDWLAHRLASTIVTRLYRAISFETANRQAANKREVGSGNTRCVNATRLAAFISTARVPSSRRSRRAPGSRATQVRSCTCRRAPPKRSRPPRLTGARGSLLESRCLATTFAAAS